MRGFTLLEILLSLGLMSIILISMSSGYYLIRQSSDKTNITLKLDAEGRYLIHQIASELNQASEVTSPSSESTSSALEFSTPSGACFSISTSTVPFSTEDFQVSSLLFTRAKIVGTTAERIDATFTLQATTSQGKKRSESFWYSTYLFL
jgi:prepilin-type N-terminal cleavage/methylation domain-containing protein